jgi:hypothetical protein
LQVYNLIIIANYIIYFNRRAQRCITGFNISEIVANLKSGECPDEFIVINLGSVGYNFLSPMTNLVAIGDLNSNSNNNVVYKVNVEQFIPSSDGCSFVSTTLDQEKTKTKTYFNILLPTISSNPIDSINSINTNERNIMNILMEHLSVEGWIFNNNWNTESDPCIRFGIKCENSVIVSIILVGNNLKVTLIFLSLVYIIFREQYHQKLNT